MPKRSKKTPAARLMLNNKRRITKLLLNKKAASVVVSTMVLTAGVLAMGIAVLYWAYSWGNLATRAYSSAEANNAKAVQERLGFEYVDYSSSSNLLTVYVINWGTANNVSIANVFLWDSTHQPIGDYPRPALRSTLNNAVISGLNMTGEGYFRITPISMLIPRSFYYIRIITDRGRTFDSTFATP